MDRHSGYFYPEVASKSEGDQKLDEIRSDMAQTRVALADKLSALQDKVFGTVEHTVDAVQETVEAAKRTFDLRYQTELHPWRMVGVAVFAGAVAGHLLGGSRGASFAGLTRDSFLPVGFPWSTPGNGTGHQATSVKAEPAAAAPEGPGLFAEELQQIKGAAIGAGMALVRDWLKQSVPGLHEQIERIMNDTTTKLGGVPVQGPILGMDTCQRTRSQGWSAAG